jgi:hypothetical protein
MVSIYLTLEKSAKLFSTVAVPKLHKTIGTKKKDQWMPKVGMGKRGLIQMTKENYLHDVTIS